MHHPSLLFAYPFCPTPLPPLTLNLRIGEKRKKRVFLGCFPMKLGASITNIKPHLQEHNTRSKYL
jgi:hypothetical protein